MRGDTKNHARIDSIDVARGIVVIIMALDHARDFFGSLTAQPTNIATTTAGLFLTRWVTHICAPMFFLLTGTSASLTRSRMAKPALACFLLTRGFWLIFLDIVVIRFALQFNFNFHVTLLTVLWALGCAMIVLSGLIWLPTWLIAGFGVILIAGHNALDSINAARLGAWAPLWTMLHQPGVLLDTGQSVVFAAYVLIPWIGVSALGYVLGDVYRWDAVRRRTALFWMGIALLVGFATLRYSNLYGDPKPWGEGQTPLLEVLSFLNTTKYPPSLLFLMMTLGPALLLLRALDGGMHRLLGPALIIGRVPLFFYVLHFCLIHLLAVGACVLRYGSFANMFESPDLQHFPFTAPLGWNFGLPIIYLVWVFVVVSLYPLCRWYADLRRRNHSWWLSYL